MKKWNVVPLVSCGGILFGSNRSEVRDQLGPSFQEIRKSIFSKNTMDAYETFHVYYSKDNKLEAIEFFDGNKIILNGKTVFPGKIGTAQKLIPDLLEEDGSYISSRLSIGISVSADDPKRIESILIGCNGYYLEDEPQNADIA